MICWEREWMMTLYSSQHWTSAPWNRRLHSPVSPTHELAIEFASREISGPEKLGFNGWPKTQLTASPSALSINGRTNDWPSVEFFEQFSKYQSWLLFCVKELPRKNWTFRRWPRASTKRVACCDTAVSFHGKSTQSNVSVSASSKRNTSHICQCSVCRNQTQIARRRKGQIADADLRLSTV